VNLENLSDIIIISTGGTFNKTYNRVDGTFEIERESRAIKEICERWLCRYRFKLIEIISKDSLDMDDEDREILSKIVKAQSSRKILIVHGTDTMETTANFLANRIREKEVVLVGSMVPFSIDKVEATANFALGVGFLRANSRAGVFIAMHSLVLPFKEIYKDRESGVFRQLS
jgi:L-asparaginase